jgi:imidazolonepropionase-like amidohydrolase
MMKLALFEAAESRIQVIAKFAMVVHWTLLSIGLWTTLVKCNVFLAQTLAESSSLAIVGAKIYRSPTEKPILNGGVLITNGKIAAVGGRRQIKIPRGVTVLDCTGLTMMAGFWNSHVHFTEPKWKKAATLASSQLSIQLQDMFLRYGFTGVFDTGSLIENTKTIRQRIENGEVVGPRILSTGPGLVPRNGTPWYVKPIRLPEVESPDQAAAVVNEKLRNGADAIKIFSAPNPIQGEPPLLMPLELIKAITLEAHRHGKWFFAHPGNDAGVNVAVEGGVDILAHTAEGKTAWNELRVAKMKRHRVALIPTLSLWKKLGLSEGVSKSEIDNFLKGPLSQVRAAAEGGGEILFGTDVGFITDYDPTDEYQLMLQAGMSLRQILASLTTAPAKRFDVSRRTGRIGPGMDADLVVLKGDPAVDIKAFSNVKYTLRRGKVIFGQYP